MSTTTPRQGPLSPQPEAESGRFDTGRTEGAGAADTLRNLRTALLLGWRVEFDWTDPVLSTIYTIVSRWRPSCCCWS